jgi:hypothetical protein
MNDGVIGLLRTEVRAPWALDVMKLVGYPGAAPGCSCFQSKRVLLALSYPNGIGPRAKGIEYEF